MMVVEYQTGTADNSLLGDKAQLPAVGGIILTQRLHPIVVLVGAIRYAWHNLIHNRISWQPYTAANQHFPQRVLKRDEITLFDLLPTDAAIVEEAPLLSRTQAVAPAVYHNTVALLKHRFQTLAIDGADGHHKAAERQHHHQRYRHRPYELHRPFHYLILSTNLKSLLHLIPLNPCLSGSLLHQIKMGLPTI